MTMAPFTSAARDPRLALEPSLAFLTRMWNPFCRDETAGPERDRFVRSKAEPGPLPQNEEDIAFAPVTHLSRWIQRRQLTSERLTRSM